MSFPRILKVESFIVDIPTIRPHLLSMATMCSQAIVLVRVHCSDGIVGRGEGTTIAGLSYGDESPEGIALAIQTYFWPLLDGLDASRPAQAMKRIAAAVVGNHFAKSAIETALWDAAGQRLGVPLSELLGGRLRERLPIVWTLASGDTGKDLAEAQEMIAKRRHRIFKVKIGRREIGDDIAHVRAIKRGLGPDAEVRVDVNMAWGESVARRAIAMLADAGCELVEQPIHRSNRAGMTRLQAGAQIPLMADEGLHGPADAYDWATRAAADVFSVKIATSGGLTAAKQVQAIADAAGVGLYGGTMLEAAIGTVAAAHLFATFPNLSYGTELFGPLLLTEEILATALTYENFELIVPDGPGLGIDLDEDKLARLRRGAARRPMIVGKVPEGRSL